MVERGFVFGILSFFVFCFYDCMFRDSLAIGNKLAWGVV